MRKPRSSLGTGITTETVKEKGNFGIIDRQHVMAALILRRHLAVLYNGMRPIRTLLNALSNDKEYLEYSAQMQIDEGRNDTQHNDVQDNDTQHNDIQDNDTQDNDTQH
jgi:hypothetical protein